MKKASGDFTLGQEDMTAAGLKANGIMRRILILSCAAALFVSLLATHFYTQRDFCKTCETVTGDFSSIMQSYRHSFSLFEIILQQKIENSGNADEIESFLKSQEERLAEIEGGDYDGVYMYYQGKYLYSWNTPRSAYDETGYDATARPWYIGAVKADGELFFSIPYPSYANDYMLATISRLQEDGETVIAYDIKLGEIGEYVERLDLFDRETALVCDADGNIIGSTNHLYQGGNYMLSAAELAAKTAEAKLEQSEAGNEAQAEKAMLKLESAEAQQSFVKSEKEKVSKLLERSGTLQYFFSSLSFGFSYGNGEYTCIILGSATELIPHALTRWAALSFAFVLLSCLAVKMIGRGHQVLTDVLTGLNNRRAFIRYCRSHIRHHSSETLGLLMLDLNHFKKINDMYGHAVGDRAILDTAEVIKKSCAASSSEYFMCRYGGDEFLLAVKGGELSDLKEMKAVISDNLRLVKLSRGAPYTLEASMGFSCGICSDKNDLERLLAEADKSMYEEKMILENIRAH